MVALFLVGECFDLDARIFFFHFIEVEFTAGFGLKEISRISRSWIANGVGVGFL